MRPDLSKTRVSLLFLVAAGCLSSGCPDTHGSGDAGPSLDAVAADAVPPPREGGDGFDAPSPIDAGVVPGTCGAMDAQLDVCAETCFAITGAFWDGSRCVESHCDCVGPECMVYADVASCEAAHAHCDAALCTSTGGAWFSRPQYCAHFECGSQPDVLCDEVLSVCDCGTYGVFVEGVGCMPGPLCELIAPTEPEPLCASTGGTWTLGICGHTTCGRFTDLDCAGPGCVCGPYQIFDDERGCIQSPECDVRLPGEDCTETRLCGEGNVCCVAGGASITMRCEAPMCGDPSGVCGPPRP